VIVPVPIAVASCVVICMRKHRLLCVRMQPIW
jgi:hypothetical protein